METAPADIQTIVVGGFLAGLVWYLCSRPKGIPPGPRGLPLVGNLFQLSDATHLDFAKLSQQYGDIFSVYMGTNLVIVLNSYKAIKEAFANMGTAFMDRPKGVALDPDCVGIFMEPYGDRIMKDKKFAVTALRSSGWGTQVIEDRIVGAVDELRQLLMKKDSKPVDMLDPVTHTTAKVICATLYSRQYSLDDPEMHSLVVWIGKILDAFTSDCPKADTMPSWLAPVIFSKVIKNMRDFADGAADAVCMKAIKDHRATLDPNKPRDFLDHYLTARREDGKPYTDRQIAATCLTFSADAIYSIGNVILWNIFFLAKFPEWQIKLQEEVDEVLGPDKSPYTTDKVNMPLTEAFQQEVIRTSSLNNFSFPHKPLKDTILCGFNIPKDARLIANFWPVNHDPVMWPEPEKFRPERHLDSDGTFVPTDKVMISSTGIRACMGQQLVRAEAFIFLTRLLQQFNFRFPEDEPEPRLEDVVENMVRCPPPYKVRPIPR